MFESISLSIYLIREAIQQKTLHEFMCDQIFFDRVVIPVILDLTTLNVQLYPFQNLEYQFTELKFNDLRDKKYTFTFKSRYLKALRNINKGLRGFILLKGRTVIGDIWCLTPKNQDSVIRHRDLELLGVKCINGDAYAVDIFIDPIFRGKKLAVPIHQSLELTLKREGFRQLYGWVYEDNISSKWLHIMLKSKELPKLRAFRFFFIRNTYRYIPNN